MQGLLKDLSVEKRKVFVFCLLLFFIAVFSVILRTRFLSVPLTDDEGVYAFVTYFWQKGARLYSDVWADRPQGIFVLYSIIFNTFGFAVGDIRFFAAVYNAVTCIVIGVIGRKLDSIKVGLISSFLFAIFSNGIGIEGFTANGELFMTLPICLSFYFYISFWDNRNHWKLKLFLSGLFASFASLIKPTALPLLGMLMVGIYLFKNFQDRRESILKQLEMVILGFISGLMPAILHGLSLGIGNFFIAVIGWRILRHNLLADDFNNQVLNILQVSPVIFLEMFLLFYFSFYALLLFKNTKRNDKLWLILLFTVFSLFGVAIGGGWFRHYFFQLVAPLSLIAAYSIVEMYTNVKNKLFLFGPLFIGLITFLSINLSAYLESNPQKNSDKIFDNIFHHYSTNSSIANYVNLRTEENDKIFIFFAHDDIYYLAKRQPAYWLTHISYIVHDKNFQSNMVSILKSDNAPAYLLLYQNYQISMKFFPSINDSINSFYYLENEFDGVKFYRRIGLGLLR